MTEQLQSEPEHTTQSTPATPATPDLAEIRTSLRAEIEQLTSRDKELWERYKKAKEQTDKIAGEWSPVSERLDGLKKALAVLEGVGQ